MVRWPALLMVLFSLAACRGRDPDALGPHRKAYAAAIQGGRSDDAVRAFYEGYLHALRQKNPDKALQFFRPDVHPEVRNALRMGLEFVKVLQSMEGRITELKVVNGRALLRTSETAMFQFRNRKQPDRRDRTYQLTRVGGDWYFEPPDLGKARQSK